MVLFHLIPLIYDSHIKCRSSMPSYTPLEMCSHRRQEVCLSVDSESNQAGSENYYSAFGICNIIFKYHDIE